VRSREVQILKVDSLELKKKENVRWRKEKEISVRDYR
jgi:hypothetical protein